MKKLKQDYFAFGLYKGWAMFVEMDARNVLTPYTIGPRMIHGPVSYTIKYDTSSEDSYWLFQ